MQARRGKPALLIHELPARSARQYSAHRQSRQRSRPSPHGALSANQSEFTYGARSPVPAPDQGSLQTARGRSRISKFAAERRTRRRGKTSAPVPKYKAPRQSEGRPAGHEFAVKLCHTR